MATEKLVNLEGLSLFAQGIKKYIDQRIVANDERFLTKNDLNDVVDMVDEDGYEIEVIRNGLNRTTERTSTLESRADKLDKYTGMPETGLPSGQNNLTARATNLENFTGIKSPFSKSLDERATSLEGRATSVENRATSLESRASKLEKYTGIPDGGLPAGQGNLSERTKSLEGRATSVENRALALERYTGIPASGLPAGEKTLDGRLDFIEPMLAEHEHTIHDKTTGIMDRIDYLENYTLTQKELEEFRKLKAELGTYTENHKILGESWERQNINVGTDIKVIANISSRVINIAADGDFIVEYSVFMNKTDIEETNTQALSILFDEDMVVERDWIEKHTIEAEKHNKKISEMYAGTIDTYLLLNFPYEKFYVMRNDNVANHVYFDKYPDIYPDEGGVGGVEITDTSVRFCKGIYSMEDDGQMTLKWQLVPAEEVPTGYYSFKFIAKVKKI